jgi:polyisoprenoid-binding protein YceI
MQNSRKETMRLALLSVLLVFRATAADYHVELAAEATKITWTLGAMLHTVHGTFRLKCGDIHFDPDTGKATGAVVMDAASGESGNESRDSNMHKKVLESAKYGEILFAPDQVEGKVNLEGKSSVKLHGVLKIHGAAHEITAPAEVTIKDNQLSADIKFDVPYVAWGMKDPSTFLLKVSKTVAIEMQATGRISQSAVGGGSTR